MQMVINKELSEIQCHQSSALTGHCETAEIVFSAIYSMDIPVFDGVPLQFRSFLQAFEQGTKSVIM